MNPITPHTHNDVNSPKLYAGDSLVNAPQEALTTATDPSTLSSGGADSLKTVDAIILQNLLTRFAELEAKLQTLGIIK